MPIRRIIIAVLSIVFLVLAIYAWNAYRFLKEVNNGYGEWGVAEMVIAYAEDHAGQPPTSWDDLIGYENRASHLITSWDFATVRAKFQIDFAALQLLSGENNGESLPVISTVSGRACDLGGARPNTMLASYFASGSVPDRAVIFEE